MALTATATTAKPTAAGTPIKIAILSDCKGAFAAFYGADVGGAIQAFVEQTGAKVKDKSNPIKGMTGGTISGHPIKLVGIGCSNDSADLAISETKRLMEKLKADILIGPLSGDESIAVAKYAKAHPKKTFVNGTAGALDTTMIVRAPNFFRWNGDGAQWDAGTGWVAYNVLGWRKVNVIMDDYSFGWTSAAGFIAEFCALGGEVTKRVFPPLNTTDYSQYVAQLDPPNATDGYFWAVGGTGTLSSLKAFEQKYGNMNSKQHMGNLFFGTPGTFTELGLRIAGSYAGGGGTAADVPSAVAGQVQGADRQDLERAPAAQGPGDRDRRRQPVLRQLLRQRHGPDQGPEGGQGRHLGRPEGPPEEARDDDGDGPERVHAQAGREPAGHRRHVRAAAVRQQRHARHQDDLQGRRRAAELRWRVLALEAAPGRDGPGVRQGRGALEGHEGRVTLTR